MFDFLSILRNRFFVSFSDLEATKVVSTCSTTPIRLFVQNSRESGDKNHSVLPCSRFIKFFCLHFSVITLAHPVAIQKKKKIFSKQFKRLPKHIVNVISNSKSKFQFIVSLFVQWLITFWAWNSIGLILFLGKIDFYNVSKWILF